MANEGSTKPTEEPFVTLSYGGTFTAKNVEDALRGANAELDAAKLELARVRGLLQRIHEYFLWRVSPDYKGRHIVEDDVIRQVNKLCKAGAESADIGKLDTADKCICLPFPKPYDGCPVHGRIISNSGSAETGGEKA